MNEIVDHYEMLWEEYENATDNVLRRNLEDEKRNAQHRAYYAERYFNYELQQFENWEYYWLKEINELGDLFNFQRLQWTPNY